MVKTHCRVIVAVEERQITLSILDSNGERLDEEQFGLEKDAEPMNPRAVAIDVWNLLYDTANAAVNGDD